MKCAKYSFNLTYNQESAKLSLLNTFTSLLCSFYAFVSLFVWVFFFLQYLKIMRPYPVCFSSSRKHPWASIYFWILVYPFHTALAYGHMMNELPGYLFRGGGCHDARHLESSARCLKLRCRVLYLLQRSLGHGFSKTSMVNSLITLEVYSEFCLQFVIIWRFIS